MFEDMPVFVMKNYCLTCDGCCRFLDAKSSFRPKVAPCEEEQIPEKDFVKTEVAKESVNRKVPYMKTVVRKEETQCVFFTPEEHTCRIYLTRPFECRLYPFLLRKKYNDIIISVHLSCPFVQGKLNTLFFERHVEDLKKYFQRKDVLSFLRNNSFLAGNYADYEEEMQDLFILKLGIRP